MRRRHPDVRVRRVADLGAHSKALKLRRQNVEHSPARNERGRPKRYSQLVTRSIVVYELLLWTRRHFDTVEGRDLGRRELVQSSVDMPAVETSSVRISGTRLVKGFV